MEMMSNQFHLSWKYSLDVVEIKSCKLSRTKHEIKYNERTISCITVSLRNSGVEIMLFRWQCKLMKKAVTII